MREYVGALEEGEAVRVGLTAENPVESAILSSGIVPIAMLEAYSPV